jgi:hypothetical protein
MDLCDVGRCQLGLRGGRHQLRLAFRKEIAHGRAFAFSQPVELQQTSIVRDVESNDHRVFVNHVAIPSSGLERTSLSAGSALIVATILTVARHGARAVGSEITQGKSKPALVETGGQEIGDDPATLLRAGGVSGGLILP